ncbi:hypothetical protein [Burkholderia phage vB_BpP_HN02]|uniref:Uncharacterized protein n=1 Tax=Burkholderia phage vB_BpP_HN02 TaxID=3116925 RepID=A0AAX4JGX3_9CAUD
MPIWLVVAISVFLSAWIVCMYFSLKDDMARERRAAMLGRKYVITYSPLGKFFLIGWLPLTIFWLSYLIFGYGK